MNRALIEIYKKHGIDVKKIKFIQQLTDWKKKSSIKILPKDIKFNTILEVGCASGMLLKEFSKELGSSKNIGVDFSKESIEMAQVELPHGIYVLGDGECLPFKDKTIDLVIASDILEHFENPEIGLGEIKRVSKYTLFKIPLEKCLKNINVNYGSNHPSGHYHKWNKRDALALLKTNYFTLLNYSIEIPPNQIKFYYERYKSVPFRQFFIILEKALTKHSDWVSIQIYGSNIFAFCKS